MTPIGRSDQTGMVWTRLWQQFLHARVVESNEVHQSTQRDVASDRSPPRPASQPLGCSLGIMDGEDDPTTHPVVNQVLRKGTAAA